MNKKTIVIVVDDGDKPFPGIWDKWKKLVLHYQSSAIVI